MTVDQQRFDPTTLRSLLRESLGELQAAPAEYQALKLRFEALERALDSGRVESGTVRRITTAAPKALRRGSRGIKLTEAGPHDRQKESAPWSSPGEESFKGTHRVLEYLWNHSPELERWNRADDPKPRKT
jgi:hypothetical protein